MYEIKYSPKDFRVIEHIDETQFQSGPFYLIKLDKKNLNTIQACEFLAKHCHIKRSEIKAAGLKDKNAHTTQYITLRKNNYIRSFSHPDMTVTIICEAHRHIFSQDIVENEFIITVRNMSGYCVKPKEYIINYFGEQRFSTNNATIGKHLIKKEFDKACEIILEENSFTKKKIAEHLKRAPNDYIGALRKVNQQIVTLYINAYQSKLWNSIVSKIVHAQNDHTKKLAIVGFDYEPDDFDSYIQEELAKENITPRSFIIKQFPEITRVGAKRLIYVPVKNYTVNHESDVAILHFTLPRGSYATEVVKQSIKKEKN